MRRIYIPNKFKSGESPWSVADLCKIHIRQVQGEAEKSGKAFSEREFSLAWRELYAQYVWLCKIKYPTMPSDFPTNVYNNVHSHLSQRKDTHPTQWFTFSLGWNGLAYRYRAMAEYDKEFTISVKGSASPLPEERYKQGKSLFGFTMNVISVTESLLFSAYSIGSILDPTVFPLAKTGHLRFSPNTVKKKFARAFPNDPLTIQIEKLLNEATYKEMNDMRIVLFHRGTVPRRFYVGGERSGIATMPINPSELSDQ